MRRALAAIGCATAALVPAVCGHSRRPAVSTTRTLTYSATTGQTLGVTLRRPDRSRALVVLVHGGGFRGGSRGDMDGWARTLTGDGYATATIDYRLTGRSRRVTFERALASAVDDARAALVRLQSDPGLARLPVVLWGYSAGAATVLRLAGERPTGVRAVVSLAGYERPDHIAAGRPPMLLFNGTADRVEPTRLADLTCRAARTVSVRCDQVVFPGATHALTSERANDIHRRAKQWLAGVLGHSR